MADNYYVQEHLEYTTSQATRPGWRTRYEFALRYIRESDTVLDCACGLGENTQMISQGCRKVIGVDIDGHFITHNKAKWPEIEYHCCDVTKALPFADNAFDVVVSIETLEHLPTLASVESALRNFHRVLKPGGTIIASSPSREISGTVPIFVLTKLWFRRLLGSFGNQQATWHGHYRHWTPDAFSRLFSANFDNISLFGQHHDGISSNLRQAPYLLAVGKKRI